MLLQPDDDPALAILLAILVILAFVVAAALGQP